MKLELKHLAPYLPYGLQMYCETMNGLETFKWTLLPNNIEDVLGFQNKPRLRPLSDLTENINLHDDFYAVPIENMTGYKLDGSISDAPITVKHLYGCSKGKIKAKFLDYWVITQLLEWHFDVFGLIPEGLALDYNDFSEFNKRFMP